MARKNANACDMVEQSNEIALVLRPMHQANIKKRKGKEEARMFEGTNLLCESISNAYLHKY